MKLFQRKSRWDRIMEALTSAAARDGIREAGKVTAGVVGGAGRRHSCERRCLPAAPGPGWAGMKLLPLAALAVGYVLGAKAGRERYDQLYAAASAMRGRLSGPPVRESGSRPTARDSRLSPTLGRIIDRPQHSQWPGRAPRCHLRRGRLRSDCAAAACAERAGSTPARVTSCCEPA